MIGVAAALVAITLGLSVIANPLRHFTDDAASELLARAPYIAAVLPNEGERGGGDFSRGHGGIHGGTNAGSFGGAND